MHNNHPGDPLDFLYEELSPEAMAEARAHLGGCEECKRETAAFRDMVKLYRSAPAPAAPDGFAEMIAARAHERAEAERAAAAAPVSDAPVPASDGEFAAMKRDVLAETPHGVRRWLFHPAWTVAASVLLICTAMMYISPRRDRLFNMSEPERTALSAPPVASPRRAQREPAARKAPPEPLPPALEPRSRALPAPAPASAPMLEQAQAQAVVAEEMAEAAPMQVPPVPVRDLPLVPGGESAVIVEMPEGFVPPQLIERPTPVDTVKLARDLAFLAGMQIGNDEFSDAWITIGLLRKYDVEKADELTAMLIELESAAETVDEPVSGKYSGLASQPHIVIVPEASEASAPSEPLEPSAPTPPAEPVREPVVDEPVIVGDPALAEPVLPMASPGVPVQAPDVPKSSPDALPPTLGESAAPRAQVNPAPARRRSGLFRWRSGARGVFTTDPYWRRD